MMLTFPAAALTSLVVIDSSVPNYIALLKGLRSDAPVLVLNSNQDGVAQITAVLAQYGQVQNLHVVSHGAPGCVYLGNSELSLKTIARYISQIERWAVSSILLYGCNVAAGDAGAEWVEKLHQVTGASVAASTRPMGAGNWQFDRLISTSIDASVAAITLPFNPDILAAYSSTLAAGDLDLTFGANGKVTTDFGSTDNAYSTLVQPDGKILVAGVSSGNFAVARYNTDGSLDSSFGSNGKAITDFGSTDTAYSLIRQADGKIVVAGLSGTTFDLARYNSDGTLDTGFGSGGKTSTASSGSGAFDVAVTLQTDGKIVVVGNGTIARYNSNGSLDSTFGTSGVVTGLNFVAVGVGIQSDGKIVVGGQGIGGTSKFEVARYSSNGVLDTSFGTSGRTSTTFAGASGAYGNSIILQPDDKILVGGTVRLSSNSSLDFATARYTANGVLDTSFGTGGQVITDLGATSEDGREIFLQPDGKILFTGVSNNNFAVVRYNADGTLDNGFATGGKLNADFGGTDEGRSIALQPDNKIVVAGFSNGNFALARYDSGLAPANQTPTNSTLPTFNEKTGSDNPFGSINITEFINPVFVDLDGDQDLDLVAGGRNQPLRYWQNNNSSFTEKTGAANPVNGIQGGEIDYPVFVDLDGDKDLDLVTSGNANSSMKYWQNNNGSFTEKTGAANPINGINAGFYTIPTFADLDGDKDLDLLVGNDKGTLKYYRNDNGSFVEQTGTANPFNGINVASQSVPVLIDLDKDQDLDLVLGTEGSQIRYYQNNNGSFVEQTGTANPFNGNYGQYTAPAFIDLDADQDLDLVVGVYGGTLKYYQNSGVTTAANQAPTDLTLSKTSVDENVPANFEVGALSTTDPNAGDSFTYTLVSGTGDTNNSAFVIVGDRLQIQTSPDFEAKPNLSIRVRTTDQGGLSVDKVLAVTVNNLNEAPTELSLSSTQVTENVPANTVIGSFSSLDPDSGSSFTYSLVSGVGGTDNTAFTIANNELRINTSPDFEAKSSYSIRVRTTDQNGLSFEKPLTIAVQDVSESFAGFVATQTADGLKGALDRLQDLFDRQLLQANLPIVGKMTGAIPNFLATLRDSIVPAIRGTGNLSADAMETLLNSQLASKFPGVQVVKTSAIGGESKFEVTLTQSNGVTKVANDLGMAGLGLTVDNASGQGNLNSTLKLAFGTNQTQGFFIDSSRTKLTSNLDFGLGTNFSASGKMGLFKVKLADNPSNATLTNAAFSTKLNDIDVPGAADDGDRLTTAEIQANSGNPALSTTNLTSDPNLGLRIVTDMGAAAIPGINTTLAGDIPLLTYVNGTLSGTPNTAFSFNNTELSLGSVANNVVLPTLKKLNTVIEPLRPVLKVLTYDLRSIGIGYLYRDLNNDGKVTILDIVGENSPALASASSFLEGLKTISDLSQRTVGSSNTGLALGSFKVDNFNPFGSANGIRSSNVTQMSSSVDISQQLSQGGAAGSLIQAFQKTPGMKFNLFDSPSNAVKMLMGQPSVLFSSTLPKVNFTGTLKKDKQIDGTPFVITAGGQVSLSANLAFGYDTYGLQQWADANYVSNQIDKVFNGFYLSNRENADGTGKLVDQLNLNLGLILGGSVGISYSPAVKLTGGLTGYLRGGPGFSLKDPDNDGKVRSFELSAQPFKFSSASLDALLKLEVEGELGGYKKKLFESVINELNILKYNANTGIFDVLGTPINANPDGSLNNSKEKIYTALRDLAVEQGGKYAIKKTLFGGLSAASTLIGFFDKDAGAQATAFTNQVTNVVYQEVKQGVTTVVNTVTSTVKKGWSAFVGFFTNAPISGGTIFLDTNFNGIQDSNEPFTISFPDSTYALGFNPLIFDTNQNGIIDNTEGQLVGSGGVDIYTGLPQIVSFTAPANSFLITPLTSLVSEMMRQGVDLFSAQEQINTALGLPTGIDLGITDANNLIESGDPLGARLEVLQSQVNSLLTQTTKLLGSATKLTAQQLSQEVVKAIVAQVQSGATLSLSNAADVQKILQATLTNVMAIAPNPKLQQLQAMIDKLAGVMASSNQRLEQIAASSLLPDFMQQLGIVKKVTLGQLGDDLAAVGAGRKSIDAVVSELSDKAFNKLIANAKRSLTQGTNQADLLRGGDKADKLQGLAGDDQIFGGLGNDRLVAGADEDQIFGDAGKDLLDGGAGKDLLSGGAGYDRLLGGNGSDVLLGGDGSDVLIGGAGGDRFILSLSETGRDRITDFTKQDRLAILGLASVTGLQTGKTLSRQFFHLGAKAGDSNDYLIYNLKTGALFFDGDGKGATKQVQIAQFSPGLNLTAQSIIAS